MLCFIDNTRLLVLQIRFQEQCIPLQKDLVESVLKNKFSNFTKKVIKTNKEMISFLR